MAKLATYPSHAFEERARAAGAEVLCMWELRGPPNTAVSWMTCYLVNKRLAIVQTYHSPQGREEGWDVFTPCNRNDIDATMADALQRCGVETAP